MSGTDASNSSDNENLCVVCFKNVEIYSIGVCDHPVCFECSTRMRVLCRQNECPICRQDMPKVIFAKTVEPFSTLFPKFERSNLQDRRYGLYFCTSEIQKDYLKILQHSCHICPGGYMNWPFKNFYLLKDHMRREHELFYCDICVENLKIFTFERRCYTRQELGHHRRKGDPDNTSHRGHPLCEFCDTRYMDSDELFRHLRRNHLFCHLCDADGKHQYYNNMDDMKRHFRDEHYLCEEGECKTLPLTAVFRTDIDLKAHITMEHSRHMSKSATKQARTLELEFTLAPRPRSENLRNKRFTERRYDEENLQSGYNVEPGGPGGGNEASSRLFVNPLTPQDFPALGSNSNSITLQSRPSTTVNFTSKVNSTFTGADFPSLGASSNRPSQALTITTNSSAAGANRAPEVTIMRTVRGQQSLAKTIDNFPALGSSSSSSGSTVRLSVNNSQDSKAPKVSIHVNHRPNGSLTTHITTSTSSITQQRPVEAFPALGSSTKVTQPMWVQAKSKKQQEPKNNKVAPAPQLPPSTLDQFPSLAKKKSSVTVPVSNTWVNLNNINSANSKSSTSMSGENSSRKELRSNAKQKQLDIETKSQAIKITENGDIKNKNKKKKKNSSDTDMSKQTKLNKAENRTSELKSTKSENKISSTSNDNVNNNENNSKNGLIKKRSELKIGTLTSPGEPSQATNDFPALNETKPPPGFNVKPPPGFTPGAFPSLGIANDLTFTSSSGQSYAITPTGTNYRPPNNFQARNQNLIKRFMTVLNNNVAIKEFKNYSDLFRNGVLSTKKYYDHCREILGDNFDDIFPELLVLLPDINKQRELYEAYEGNNKKNLLVCENCKQVIFKKELTDHYNYHTLDNHFPSLGSVPQTSNIWKK